MKNFGRPTKYHPKYIKKLIKYFDIPPNKLIQEKFYFKNGDEKVKDVEIANDLPTIIGFARSIGVTDATLVNWTKKHKDFLSAYNWAKKLQEHIWMVNGLKGLYNSHFAALMGKNIYGWKDKTESETKHTGKVIVEETVYERPKSKDTT